MPGDCYDLMYILLNKLLCHFGSCSVLLTYRGADKSLARPERKQATVTEDFDVHISY